MSDIETTEAPAAPFPEAARIAERFPGAVEEAAEFRGEHTVVVRREEIEDVLLFLRDDPELRYNYLADLTSVDYLPRTPRFEVIYHLKSLSLNRRLRVKVRLPGEDPVVESAVPVWPGAEWPEREVFDLMGIQFRNHPDPRRILLPDEWDGHPLRKDFPMGKVEVNFDKTRGK